MDSLFWAGLATVVVGLLIGIELVTVIGGLLIVAGLVRMAISRW